MQRDRHAARGGVHPAGPARGEAGYGGALSRAGVTAALVLFGDENPSGKLAISYPASDAQGPAAGRPALTLAERAFAISDEGRREWRVMPGRYTVRLGTSVADLRHEIAIIVE